MSSSDSDSDSRVGVGVVRLRNSASRDQKMVGSYSVGGGGGGGCCNNRLELDPYQIFGFAEKLLSFFEIFGDFLVGDKTVAVIYHPYHPFFKLVINCNIKIEIFLNLNIGWYGW